VCFILGRETQGSCDQGYYSSMAICRASRPTVTWIRCRRVEAQPLEAHRLKSSLCLYESTSSQMGSQHTTASKQTDKQSASASAHTPICSLNQSSPRNASFQRPSPRLHPRSHSRNLHHQALFRPWSSPSFDSDSSQNVQRLTYAATDGAT
jgi:hypothetical protein